VDTLLTVSLFAMGAAMVLSAGHVLLTKHEPRAALVWMALCLGWPGFGVAAYWLFGVNRIRSRGHELQARFPAAARARDASAGGGGSAAVPAEFTELARISAAVTGNSLVGGNRIRMLVNGDEAYPAMLEAIRGAERSVTLCTYIFDRDPTGLLFADALAAAAGRGVDVKVLIDGVGELYSLPRMGPKLARRGVRVARFLPPTLMPPELHVNLRNHRKLLVVDRQAAFTGGMNIRDANCDAEPSEGGGKARSYTDLHFRVDGPVVEQMERVFLDDWTFATGDAHTPPDPPAIAEAGVSLCRGISDGPDHDLDKLKWVILGALSAARSSIRIMTPYFIPDGELTAALNAAALRGVEVELVLPGKNNLPFVHWASIQHLRQLLPFGVRAFHQPPPFAHTKLLLVDDHYAQVGSANLDPRSLRLNFEFNLEIYGGRCVRTLKDHYLAARSAARELSEADVLGRSLPVRLRDATASLFSPYL